MVARREGKEREEGGRHREEAKEQAKELALMVDYLVLFPTCGLCFNPTTTTTDHMMSDATMRTPPVRSLVGRAVWFWWCLCGCLLARW
jgi:hypothetical protein